MVAEIIINSIAKELNRSFDYIIPEELTEKVKVGARVFVPFGRTKKEEGFVIDIKESSEFATKEIISVEDVLLNENKINLAKLMARRYFCNISDCIKLMLPPGNTGKNFEGRVKEKTANFVYLKKEIDEIEFLIDTEKLKNQKHIRVLRFLSENEGIAVTDLETITDVSRAVLKTLEKNGYIEIVQEEVKRNPFANRKIEKDAPLKLNEEQQLAFNKIKKSQYKEFLLYGVTGSRKNWNIPSINRRGYKKRQNSNSASTRDFINSTNGG